MLSFRRHQMRFLLFCSSNEENDLQEVCRNFLQSHTASKWQSWKLSRCLPDFWRRKWQPTPAFLPGESHGQRSLVGNKSMGSQRVRHDLVTQLPKFTLCFSMLPRRLQPFWGLDHQLTTMNYINISKLVFSSRTSSEIILTKTNNSNIFLIFHMSTIMIPLLVLIHA